MKLSGAVLVAFVLMAYLPTFMGFLPPVSAATSPTDIVLGGQTVAVGETLTVPVALQAPAGVSGFTAVLTVSDGTVMSITALRVSAYLDVAGIRETSLRITVTDLAGVWGAGDAVAELVQVDVLGEAVGKAFVTVEMTALDDDAGTALPLSSDSLLVTVQ